MSATSTANYTVSLIASDQISATDLQEELADDPTAECFIINFYDADGFQRSDRASGVYYPASGRMGIAWGADATWADVSSLEAGVALWATDQEAWEAAR
jgi:hypothetical protein